MAGLDGSLNNDVWSLQLPGDWRSQARARSFREAYFCCSALIGSEDCDEGTGAIGASFRDGRELR
jgi:hypothetical protein